MTATVKIKLMQGFLVFSVCFGWNMSLFKLFTVSFISPAPGGTLGIWENCHEFANYTFYMYIELTEGLLKRPTSFILICISLFTTWLHILCSTCTTVILLIWCSEQTVCIVIVIHIVRGKIETWYCTCL